MRSSFSSMLLAGTFLTGLAAASSAQAINDIKSPYAEEGELELEYKGAWTHDDDDKANKNKQKHVAAAGYGFAPYWFGEIEAEFERESGDSGLELSEIELEVKRQVTKHGEFWWDVGFLGAYGHVVERHKADKAEAAVLLQNTFHHFTTRANFGLEHQFGTTGKDTEFWGRAFTRYNLTPAFKPGVEWQGEFGTLGHSGGLKDQEHFVGPAAYGRLPWLDALTGGNGKFSYELAYLFGVTDSAPDGAVRWKLEYGLEF